MITVYVNVVCVSLTHGLFRIRTLRVVERVWRD